MPACVQVTANNVSVIQLSGLQPVLCPVNQLRHDRLLTGLCDRLEACLNYALPQDLMLALLLSAASVGVPTTGPTQSSDAAVRNQVNVHICCHGGGVAALMSCLLPPGPPPLLPSSLSITDACLKGTIA